MGKSSLSLTNSHSEMSRKTNKFKSNISHAKELINKKKIRRRRKQQLQNLISKLQSNSTITNESSCNECSPNKSDVTLRDKDITVIEISSAKEDTHLESSDCTVIENTATCARTQGNTEGNINATIIAKVLPTKSNNVISIKIDKAHPTKNDNVDATKIDITHSTNSDNVHAKRLDNIDGWSIYESCIEEDTVDGPTNGDICSTSSNRAKKRKAHRLDTTEDVVLVDNEPSRPQTFASSTPKRPKLDNSTQSNFLFKTIDLTGEIDSGKPVINVDSDSEECTFVSETGFSMSRDSEVTVLQANNRKISKMERNIRNRLEGMNTPRQKELLKILTKNIFNGCQMKKNFAETTLERSVQVIEDVQSSVPFRNASVNSFGSNIYNPIKEKRTGLRMIVIDGSNVAVQHGRGRGFSVQGLKICIDYFLRRGHSVKAFVPRFRCKFGKSSDPKLLDKLERDGYVIYTPSREVQGRQITSYDDRYIVQCAAEFDGVIVSGDNYRDLLMENPRWKFVIENRLLQFTWVENMLMFPRDPLGRNGPTLEEFLKHD